MKVLMIIAQNGFRDEEFFEPRDIFVKNGIEVKVASERIGMARGKLSGTVMSDLTVGESRESDFDAVVFVGGPGAAVYLNDPAAHKLAKDFYEAGKIVAAICMAPSILANAGILSGKKATAFPNEKANLVAHGAEFTGATVEVDGKIVTGCGPEAAKEFGEKIVELLKQ